MLYLPHTAVSGAAVQSLSYKVTRKVLKGVIVSSDLLCFAFHSLICVRISHVKVKTVFYFLFTQWSLLCFMLL